MLWGLIGVYHTQFSVALFLVSTFLSKMFDVGDLPVLTFGNCVLMAEWLGLGLSGPLKYTYVFYVFFTFFQNPKKHDFLRFFELLHTFSRTLAKMNIREQTWQCISELRQLWLVSNKEWGEEIQIWWEPCADQWKMCTFRKKRVFICKSKS